MVNVSWHGIACCILSENTCLLQKERYEEDVLHYYWRLRIKPATSWPGLPGKWPLKQRVVWLLNDSRMCRMLHSGTCQLAVGGRLVFCTYSMNPIENEAIVASLLTQQKGFLLVTSFVGLLQLFDASVTVWPNCLFFSYKCVCKVGLRS